MRVATIDIGTNTVLLLVAELRDGELVAIDERATITRLGEGVDRTRALLPAAIARTCACLDAYATIIRGHGVDATGVVGTSAMRDASGGDLVRAHVKSALGVEARVISGDEEARLTFAGAMSGVARDGGDARGLREVTVFDIGGGSTEVVVGTLDATGAPGAIGYAHSFDVGSVRLTERHVHHDPPTAAELDAARADAAAAFASIPADAIAGDAGDARAPVGIAGTMTTLAAVAMTMETYDGARVHGHVMDVAELARVVAHLASLPLAERRTLPGLEPKRADVIVAGGIVALALLERLGASRVRISDRGVRWGLAAELARGAR
jgi:exopolyphosphatase/guanosine-5'-triphosphate,3'-diphosphate pyrophosphatase